MFLTTIINNPPEGWEYIFSSHFVVYPVWDWFGCFIFCLLGGISLVILVRGHYNQLPFFIIKEFKNRTRILCIVAIYLSIWLTFSFAYHGLFQTNLSHFKVTASTSNQRAYENIESHKHALDSINEAQEILNFTLAGLRSSEGQNLLAQFVNILNVELREIYVTALSLAIVKPQESYSFGDIETLKRLQAKPEEALDLFLSYQTVRETRPGIVSTLPLWDIAQQNSQEDVEKLYQMKFMLQNWLASLKLSPKEFGNYVPEDNYRLEKYLRDELSFDLSSSIRIDLGVAKDAIILREVGEEVFLLIGKAEFARLLDFTYFSLITLTTVGYGDIIPNSTFARSLIMIEVLLGMATLVVIVGKYLQ